MGDVDDTAGRRPGTRDPRRSRQRALKILFQADLRRQRPGEVLDRIAGDPEAVAMLDDADKESDASRATLDEYAIQLVRGVDAALNELDDVIGRFARNWTVERMPTVDRNVLRLGAYELLHEDTSAAVVIDEALELAKALSTDDSRRFVNGILESVRQWDESGRPVLP